MGKDEVTYDDVKAGREELDAQKLVTETAIKSAIGKYGIVKKRLNRKKAAEQADKLADRIEDQLLTEGKHNPLYEKKHDEVKKGNLYQRSLYLNDKYGFDRSTFIRTAIEAGLSDAQVTDMIRRLFVHKEETHRGASTADVHHGNIEDKVKKLEKSEGFKVAQAHRSYEKLLGGIYAYRAGILGGYIEETPGVSKTKK